MTDNAFTATACAVSHGTCVEGKIFAYIRNPDLPLRYTICMALRLRQIELSTKNSVWPSVKDYLALYACAKSRQP